MTTRIDALDTPFAAIDLDVVERNLARAQRYFDEHKLALRPHIKTHKIPELARRQVELGAGGITCQKIGEAEVMADAGIADILLTFNIVGPLKLGRLVGLARRDQAVGGRRQPRGRGRAVDGDGRGRPRRSPCWSSATPAPSAAACRRRTRRRCSPARSTGCPGLPSAA